MAKKYKKEKNINKNSNKNVINIKINTHKKSSNKKSKSKRTNDTPQTTIINNQQPLPHYNRAQDYRDAHPFGNQLPTQTPISKPIPSPIATSTYFDTTPFRTLSDLSSIHENQSTVSEGNTAIHEKKSTVSDEGNGTWHSMKTGTSIKSEPSIKTEDIPNIFADPNPINNPFMHQDESAFESAFSSNPMEDEVELERKYREKLKNQKDYQERKALVDKIRVYDRNFTPRQDIGKKKLKEILELAKQTSEINKKV